MKAAIAGFVLRCKNRQNTANFYSHLGLTVEDEHQHDCGPMHFSLKPTIEELAVEIYTASNSHPTDAFMLEVDSIEDVLATVKNLGIEPKMPIKNIGIKFRFTYITDPDGRDVMLLQKIPAE